MRSRYLFLLLYLLAGCFGTTSAQWYARYNCTASQSCAQMPDPTSHFLRCVGLPANATGRDHMHRLKEMLEAMMDVYTFMKSSLSGVPLLSLQGALDMNPTVDPYQDEDLVKMWMEVKMKPLLKSISKHFLSCLSTKSFSCSTYQTVVKEISYYYSELDYVRQKWIYAFFMYPFLSGDRVAGCVSPHESSEQWLLKNFGAFSAMARMKDFSALNMVFSGLEVLHLLTPAQKAELMLMPEFAGLENGTLSLVFHSLLTGGPGPHPTTSPGGGYNWTSPGGGYFRTTPGGGHYKTTPGGGHYKTTPGGGHYKTTPGGGNYKTSPGGDHYKTTPGGDHYKTTPGGDHYKTTPGGGYYKTTPGGGNYKTTPGGDHYKTTPGGGHYKTTPGGGYYKTSPGGGNYKTSPGGDHYKTSPGGGNYKTTPGGGHYKTTPGGGNYKTSPGGGHYKTTPGGGRDKTTPGGGNYKTSPGGGNYKTSPGGDHYKTTPGGGYYKTSPGGGNSWTSPEYPYTYNPYPTHDPYLPSPPPNSFREIVNGFMRAVRPIRSFVHDFVSFTKETDLSEVRSTTLTQFLLNWTLAELADMYRPHNESKPPPDFDVMDVEDWYQHVVMPLLRRFMSDGGTHMPREIKLAFHEVFYLDHMEDVETDEETPDIQELCSITFDKRPCGLTNAVENIAKALQCAARSNLVLTDDTVMRLTVELTKRLNSLMKELSTVDFRELASDIQQIFSEPDPFSPPQENLEDPEYIKLWFRVKIDTLESHEIPAELLSCLSTKNFSCPVFQTLVEEFSEREHRLYYYHYPDPSVYHHFIYPFLLHHNTSVPQCISSANQSEWMIKNFGAYLKIVPITDFYLLNPNFSGLEVLHLLTPHQMAEMILWPLPTPPEKDVVINRIFDYLFEAPYKRQLGSVLSIVAYLSYPDPAPCSVYAQIFVRLYGGIQVLPRDMEPVVWPVIDKLINIVPDECVPENFTCPVTEYDAADICRGTNSSHLLAHMKPSMAAPCGLALETYACGQLQNFTAHQLASLLSCNLPGNSKHSLRLWKMLLTKLSSVLDPALDLLANMNSSLVGSSAMEVLDVIGEIRVSMLTDEQLMNSSVIRKWFSVRLNGFLPHASVRFLHCLGGRNLSCRAYQQILQEFNRHYENMTGVQRHAVAKGFILRFLSHPHSGPGCVSNSSEEWLRKNFGRFYTELQMKFLLPLNPFFKPLKVLHLLSPEQIAELLVLLLPTSQEKDVVINMIFNHLTEPVDEEKLHRFLGALAYLGYKAHLSCSSYRIMFMRLDTVLPSVSPSLASYITHLKMQFSMAIPQGCIIYSGKCNITMTNETDICIGVNSTMLQHHLASGHMNGRFCDFPVVEIACASLSGLKADDLAAILACNRTSNSSGSRPIWKLLLTKASHVLDRALDLLNNTAVDPNDPAASMILDSIREIRLDTFSVFSLNNPAFVKLWFRRLRPFLPAASSQFLSCLTTKELTCSSFQHIVQVLSHLQPHMTLSGQKSVYNHFIKDFLTRNTTDASCSAHINNSGEWLHRNLGGFSVLVSFKELQMLNPDFSAMEALPQLTVKQLVEVASTPGQLSSAAQVAQMMKHVPNRFLSSFFDDFSPAIMGHQNMFPPAVRSAMLQVVFDRANLSDHSVGDSVVSVWLHSRLRPLLFSLSPQHVGPFFRILAGRKCSIEQQGFKDLNSTISSLSEDTQKEIHNHIVQILKGPKPLQCYGNNYNVSFYTFLKSSFMGFQFPKLTTFISLMPHDRMHQLVNSMPPSALGDFLRRPDVVDNDAELCVIYKNFVQTPMFLENESLPAVVRRPTLPCVWPMALSSSDRSEVNAWFDRRLHNYLPFLTKSLLSPQSTKNASCLAFQKLVSVMDEYNFTAAGFKRDDVFDTIKDYLHSDTEPRCYSESNPELNSTAWFVDYIGAFIIYLTLEDLQMFGSQQMIQSFMVNPLNLALFNDTEFALNFTDYVTELIYLEQNNFNPLLLPLLFRCFAPGPAFSQLTQKESMIVLYNLTTLCTDLDPQVSAALAGNLGDEIDATAISALGNESTGLSTGQIKTINPKFLMEALSTLGSVMGWNKGQAKAVVQSLMSSGALKINSSSSLFMLGSLVVGVPAKLFTNIGSSQLLAASKNPSFVGHLMTAPNVVQQTFVTKIVSMDSNSEMIIQNVPDEMATQIPRALLLGFSNDDNVISKLNKKKWKRQQVELFFSVVAVESATAALGSPNNLSSSVLQGFTCTGVRTIKKVQIKKLIKACRRKGRNKVTLVETQLTCMYNYIKGDPSVTSFDLYPPDMLLYYDYSLVPQASCRSYFEQLAEADFSVFSSALSYKVSALFDNAKSCLGITSTSLTYDNVSVLGNMCCTLDGSYIENSDPFILEKLKICPDLTSVQAAAVESLLQSGKTQYGDPSTWDLQTLKNLEILPLYMTSTFFSNFNKKTKRKFLRYFLKVLKTNGVKRWKMKQLKKEVKKSLQKKSKRSIGNECTVGEITQVVISDESFPFDYDDIDQFNFCLSAATVRDNLDSITEKVDQEDYLKIVLSKLREAYAANSTIPEDQVQLLGPASRAASTVDINMWTVTQIDTLAALMDSSDGDWDPSLAKAVITKYLSSEGNTLGTAELNTIDTNLCSLDVDVLKNISQQSLKDADALNINNCTKEKKRALFTIAEQAFSTNTRTTTISPSSYQLTQPFLGGATTNYVQRLASSNISMDMATFTSLDEDVVLNLTVSEVGDLLGSNVADLKSYENESLVQNWISRQSQEELDKLAIELVGGRTTPTTTSSPTTTNSGSATTNSGSATTNSGSATTNSGSATTNSGSATTNSGSATTTNSGPAATTNSGSATTNSGSATTNSGSATTNSGSATTNSGSATTNSGSATTNSGSATTTNSGPAATTNSGSATTNSGSATTNSGSATTNSGSGTTSSGPAATSMSPTTAAPTTTGHGTRIRADAGFSLLVLLALLIASHI